MKTISFYYNTSLRRDILITAHDWLFPGQFFFEEKLLSLCKKLIKNLT